MNSIKKANFIKKLSEMAERDILSYTENGDLAPHSTFKIGGKADFIVKVQTREALVGVLKQAREDGIKYTVIGNGSNILFSDERYEGAIILTTGMTALSCEDNIIEAECGYSLTALASRAQKLSLTGLEFAYGIPGSVGGAVFMNAGAYDGEIKTSSRKPTTMTLKTMLWANLSAKKINSDTARVCIRKRTDLSFSAQDLSSKREIARLSLKKCRDLCAQEAKNSRSNTRAQEAPSSAHPDISRRS